jgi:protein-S-isoprenylcysteine O-methyltransferase Ste14
MNIWKHFSRQGRKEYSARTRLAAMACESLIFVFGIPAFLFWRARVGSAQWQFRLSPVLSACCVVVAAIGLSFALWTVWVQFRHARGTPVPIMATKKVLTDGPYSFCRNPMALGTLVYYFGIALFTSSCHAVLPVLIFALCLLAYIKLIEEKELSLRFGDEYSRYKQSIPFIVPHISLHAKKSKR